MMLRQYRFATAHFTKVRSMSNALFSMEGSVENVGSVARDHLANERTFLAVSFCFTLQGLVTSKCLLNTNFNLTLCVYYSGQGQD